MILAGLGNVHNSQIFLQHQKIAVITQVNLLHKAKDTFNHIVYYLSFNTYILLVTYIFYILYFLNKNIVYKIKRFSLFTYKYTYSITFMIVK